MQTFHSKQVLISGRENTELKLREFCHEGGEKICPQGTEVCQNATSFSSLYSRFRSTLYFSFS